MTDPAEHEPLTSQVNQFQGINPIVNDMLQEPDKTEDDKTWEEFHGHHISDLTKQLLDDLRKEFGTGYTARMEKGLQIRYIGGEPGKPESDVMVIDHDKNRPFLGPANLPEFDASDYAITVKPATAFVADPEHYGETEPQNAIGVYKGDGTPVAWIELLSPANKPGSSYYPTYLNKRESLLENRNVVFVEIDYLNQISPSIDGHPDYTKQEPGSTPYRISIIDSRHLEPEQNLKDVDALIFGFGVDQPIPNIPIPLHGNDVVHLNAQKAYNTTYADFYYGDDADYRKLPEILANYTEPDQDRMLARLLTVNHAANNGVDLNAITAPLPIDEVAVAPLIQQFREQAHEFMLDDPSPKDWDPKNWDIEL